ncbi:hypothetical protein P8935_02435 [Telmatobacter sp. DSM 110680]|uniref:Uncharacterized protein n=1 Tax=Telmatobacter sp. DSM 110680 TaxID=3036704 RepID=A0AAU7DLQ3_9BACT
MRLTLIASISAGILIGTNAGAQISPSPTQARALTAPGQQRPQQPPAHQQPISPIDRSPQPTQIMNLPGTLMGYVYWDTSSIQYDLNAPCTGFSVTISQGQPPSGSNLSFEQFTVLGTYNNNFSSIGTIGKYAVCQYAVDHLPEGKDLQVHVMASSKNFKTVVFPSTPPTANEPNRPIQIINGKCNNLPPAVPTLATLGSNWWTCGDYAYNVNFVMQPPQNIPGITSGTGTTLTIVQSQTLLPRTSSGDGMLNPGTAQSPQPGSFGAAGPVPTQAQQAMPSVNWGDRNNQTVLGNRDVIQMLNSGLPESVIVTRIRSAKGSFDLSAEGCNALQQANVSMKILNAMGDGSVTPCPGFSPVGAPQKALSPQN